MIPVGKPSITEKEVNQVNKALLDGYISGSGLFITEFENKWATHNGYTHAVACNSGTTAMYLALMALGIKKGDEVLVPDYTMIATAWAVTYTGAKPVFVDCLDDLTMDPTDFKAKITAKTKATIIVPIYGRPVNPNVYRNAIDAHLFIVEDFAEAHGIKPRGDIVCYSFQANKIITTGEGGMCLTNDKRVADEMRKYSSLYFDEDRTMIHAQIGHNFRMTSLQASFGIAQIDRFEELRDARVRVAYMYDRYLDSKYRMPKREVVWVYDIKVDDQEKVKKALLNAGIDSRYGFKPMSEQPMYQEKDFKKTNAYKWSRKILYLPTYAGLTEQEVISITRVLNLI